MGCGYCSSVGCMNCPFRQEMSTELDLGEKSATGIGSGVGNKMKLNPKTLLIIGGVLVVGFIAYKKLK